MHYGLDSDDTFVTSLWLCLLTCLGVMMDSIAPMCNFDCNRIKFVIVIECVFGGKKSQIIKYNANGDIQL
jgi:hypothetical protein